MGEISGFSSDCDVFDDGLAWRSYADVLHDMGLKILPTEVDRRVGATYPLIFVGQSTWDSPEWRSVKQHGVWLSIGLE